MSQKKIKYFEKPSGGRGMLFGGVPGTKPGKVVTLGGGIAGFNACKMAAGLGSDITIPDIDPKTPYIS